MTKKVITKRDDDLATRVLGQYGKTSVVVQGGVIRVDPPRIRECRIANACLPAYLRSGEYNWETSNVIQCSQCSQEYIRRGGGEAR